MPHVFPVVAIRDAVHFPGLINTLLVVREPSVKAISAAIRGEHRVVVLSQKDMSVEDPTPSNLFEVGVLSEVLQGVPLPDTSLRVALRGVRRVRAYKITDRKGCFVTQVEDLIEEPAADDEIEALSRTAIELFTKIVEDDSDVPPESLESVIHAVNSGRLADAILHHLPVRPQDKQDLLEELNHRRRLEGTVTLLMREHRILELRGHINDKVERELGAAQREYYLREQLRVIQSELQHAEDPLGEVDEFRRLIEKACLPEEAEARALAEVRRLDRSTPAGPESIVSRNYLETLISLPWHDKTEDRVDVRDAQRVLDARHFGLESIKDRILDFLAVWQLRGSSGGSVLCFVGPPGVGKTSLARSVAEALGRRFVRIALGGVQDEAEIRGHRRTYVGSMPGRVIQALRDCGSRNPVILLDEIDKIGQSAQGDPMNALLEVLDPEQNKRFSDHYVEAPFDLSEVLFICTANLMERLPSVIRDRMEQVSFSAYTDEERCEIARRFLVPAARRDCGLSDDRFEIGADALHSLVRDYTHEAGVRALGRLISRLSRKAARRIAEGKVQGWCVGNEDLYSLFGKPTAAFRYARHAEEAGVALALVVSEAGGGIVPIEASWLPAAGERPEVLLTGNLGQTMRESALAAVTFLQGRLEKPIRMDLHVHVPEGGVPKDGPSAGLTMLLAMASAESGRPMEPGFAVTG